MDIPSIHAVTPVLTAPVEIFLAVLLIILVTPLLLNKLKIPHVIGLIIAGVIVGPYGVNLLARDMSFEVFGQVGILYLMFLAGIEIDMYHLKKNLKRGAVFGVFTFVVPMIVGTVASHLLLHLDVLTSMLMASMFAAHTLIAYPIVSRFGLTRTSPVVIAITGTIFTVLGSLIVLAAVVGIFREGEFKLWGTLLLLLKLSVYCVAVFYIYPRVTKWFFRRWNDNILQFIYVLAMMFLAAQLASLAGIETVFGAFFSGLVLNRYIPAKSPLMGRIEFVGNAIFIPYFLIGVGMMLNIGVIAQGWGTIYAAAVMSCIAMVSKWIAARLTQICFKLRTLDRTMLYQLSNAHTAVALAVVTIGYGMGLFDEVILNGTVVMILITCTVSSLGTFRAAQRLKVEMMSEESTEAGSDHGKKGNVLIPVANPQTADELVNLALMMKGGIEGNVYALHVRNDNSASSRAIGQNSLDVAEQTAASVDVKITPLERYDLNFVTGVVNTVEERDIDKVIIGLHRRTNVIDSFFGDKLNQLLRSTNKMVVISRCFIPVITVARIVVTVPDKAQFETGFAGWVASVCNLAGQVGCRVIFCCSDATRASIAGVIVRGRFAVKAGYRNMDGWDDFILLSNRIKDDDLFIVVSARRASLSHSGELDELPDFLKKYFARNNLIVIYPEQFGDETEAITMADMLSTDIVTSPSPLWLRVKSAYKKVFTPHKPSGEDKSDDLDL